MLVPPSDAGAYHCTEILESTGVTVKARLKFSGAVGKEPATTSARMPLWAESPIKFDATTKNE